MSDVYFLQRIGYGLGLLGFVMLTCIRPTRSYGWIGLLGALLIGGGGMRSNAHDIHGSLLFMLPGVALVGVSAGMAVQKMLMQRRREYE